MNTGKSIFKTKIDFKGDKQINGFEITRDGETIGVVGADPVVHLIDTETQRVKMKLQGEEGGIPGHSNRVFSIKFEEDQNMILTSGWDQRIIIWDLRTGLP